MVFAGFVDSFNISWGILNFLDLGGVFVIFEVFLTFLRYFLVFQRQRTFSNHYSYHLWGESMDLGLP